MTVDRHFVVKKLQSLDQAIVLFSGAAKQPFIECDPETYDDQMYIYAQKSDCMEEAKTFVEKGYPIQGISIPQDKLTRFLADCFFLGINQIVFCENGKKMSVPLDQVVIKPDFSKLPEEKRPLTNASLQLSAIYFVQELGRQIPPEEKDNEHLKELEEEMEANLAKAQFLLPIKAEKKMKPGEKLVPGKFQVGLVKLKNGDSYLPIFSDVTEFARFNKKGEYQGILLPIEKISQLIQDPCKGAILNAGSFALRLPITKINGILERFFEFEKA